MNRTEVSPAEITRVWPLPGVPRASDDDIVSWYGQPSGVERWARVNFVSSADGSATHAGLSGGLSGSADHRVFDLLRTMCDVVVVGAGTVRAEGYGAMRVGVDAVRRRVAAGLQPQPVFALVSARLDLDPASSIFTDAPVRPLLLTVDAAPESNRRSLERVADVVSCGDAHVDAERMLAVLADRGLPRVHCEGGPHLFGSMVARGAFDELCLTLSPLLEGGTGSRITNGPEPPTPVPMRLAHVLESEGALLLRYLRE